MRILSRFIFALGLTVLVVNFGPAQDVLPVRINGNLMANEEIQKELKLTKKQVEEAKKISNAATKKFEEEWKDLAKLPPKELDLKLQELFRKADEQEDAELEKILDKDQAKRYKQIALQGYLFWSGVGIFAREDVAKALLL